MVGRSEAELTGGLGSNDIHHPDERGSPTGAVEAGASPDRRFEGERRFVRPDSAVVWVRGSVAIAGRDPQGRPTRAAAVMKDVTSEKQAEEPRTLLMREVDHRAQRPCGGAGDASPHSRRGPGSAPLRRHGAGAHAALARPLGRGGNARAGRGGVGALRPPGADGERARLDGPPVLLVPETAQPVGMVLHELAPNAATYGALPRPEGRVEVPWRPSAGPAGGPLVEFRESGGPALDAPPIRPGFGTRLVARTVRQLGGEAAMDWAAEGLRCSFAIPADRFQQAVMQALRGKRPANRQRR